MKKLFACMLALLMVMSMFFGASAESTREGYVNTGKLHYDLNKEVNNGEPMTLEFWVQVELEETYRKWCDAYTALHPNITFNITSGSYDDHFMKLGMALPNKTGPHLFHMHNGFTDQFMANLKPYDPAVFPLEDLREDYTFVDESLYSGNMYYQGLAVMSCGVFYNKKMWAEAGLTENDIPKTWDDLAAAAVKLTQYDENGKVKVAGFNYNEMSMEYLITAMKYELGSAMFEKDGRTPLFNDDMKKVIEWLKNLYVEKKAVSVELPMSILSFSQSTSAMTYIGTWFGGWMQANAPDVEYGFFIMPSPDGNVPAAYDRSNIEVSPAINGNVTDAEYAVINDFLCYLLSNDNFVLDFALKQYGTPTKKCLIENPDVQADEVLGTTARFMDRLIYPGNYPDSYHSNLKKYFYDEVMLNGKDIDEMMKACKEEIIDSMESTEFVSEEGRYPHADELKFE